MSSRTPEEQPRGAALVVRALVWVCSAGCGGAGPAERTVGTEPTDLREAAKAENAAPNAETPAQAAPAGAEPRVIVRPLETRGGRPVVTTSELGAVVAGGPGRLLSYVRVSPAFRSSRFLGHRIEELLTDDPRFRAPHLRKGDVILRINGFRVERPEQYIKAFESLKGAREISFDLFRDEKRVRLVYDVEDRPAGGPGHQGAASASE